MYLRWSLFILIVLALAPFALAEKPLAIVSSPSPVELGGTLISHPNQAPAPLGGFLTTTDLVGSSSDPILVADNKPKPPPPPPPPPKPKSKSKDKDSGGGGKG